MTFREAVEKHQQLAYSLACRLLGNEEESRDIVQEAFIRVWKNWDRYRQEIKFSTWLYTIVSNLCLDKLRARSRRKTESCEVARMPESIDFEPGADEVMDRVMISELIRNLADGLPEKQQLVFVLRDLQDLEMEEVCDISGLKPEQVKANLYLARKSIREKIICNQKLMQSI
jgi:RNA polymerase sigma-70 factor, ECF subfamily